MSRSYVSENEISGPVASLASLPKMESLFVEGACACVHRRVCVCAEVCEEHRCASWPAHVRTSFVCIYHEAHQSVRGAPDHFFGLTLPHDPVTVANTGIDTERDNIALGT